MRLLITGRTARMLVLLALLTGLLAACGDTPPTATPTGDTNVQITMTLTAPSCPAAQSLPVEVDQKVRALQDVNDVHVQVTWDPPWDKSMMSEEAQLELGWL